GLRPRTGASAAGGESTANFGPGNGLDRSALELGNAAVHLGRPRRLGVFVDLGVEAVEQRSGERRTRFSRQRQCILEDLRRFALHSLILAAQALAEAGDQSV